MNVILKLKKIGIFFLLMTGAISAFARPDNRDAGDAGRNLRREQRQDGQHGSDGRQYGYENHSGDMMSDGQKKSRKMSQEEKRALRRQINEAGQDIYTPRR